MTDLARRYGVNRDTLARAIAILEAEGLVWAVPRRGTVVRYGMSGRGGRAGTSSSATWRRNARLQLPVRLRAGSVEAPHPAHGAAGEADGPAARQDARRAGGNRGHAPAPRDGPGDRAAVSDQ